MYCILAALLVKSFKKYAKRADSPPGSFFRYLSLVIAGSAG